MNDFSEFFGADTGTNPETQPAPKAKSPELIAYEEMQARNGAERVIRMFGRNATPDFLRKVAIAVAEHANNKEAGNAR